MKHDVKDKKKNAEFAAKIEQIIILTFLELKSVFHHH